MRVALDCQPLCGERTGVGQYAYYLARYLPAISPSDEFVALAFGRWSGACEGLRADNLELRCYPSIPPRGISLLWKTIDWPPADVFTGPVDVFHFPSFVARRLRGARAVATIHDLAYRRMPEYCEPKNVAFLEKHIPRTLERAALVLADSEFTARELMDLYGYPREKIRVTHLGVGEAFSPSPPEECLRVRRRYGLPERFILCVATVEPRKNLVTLLEAYGALLEGGVDIPPLVIVGSDGWRAEAERLGKAVETLGLGDRVIRLRYHGHDELPPLYSAAELFVFPSLYEGFGLPPLEAMACGTPVVCSDAASLPEAAGDAAIMVEPRDAEALAGAMGRVLGDGALRADLVGRGLERAGRFSWEKTARLTLDAYGDAVKS